MEGISAMSLRQLAKSVLGIIAARTIASSAIIGNGESEIEFAVESLRQMKSHLAAINAFCKDKRRFKREKNNSKRAFRAKIQENYINASFSEFNQ